MCQIVFSCHSQAIIAASALDDSVAVILFQHMDNFFHPMVGNGVGNALAGFAEVKNSVRL